MKIACLAWGSLVWDPHDLPIQGQWYEDGPLLPIEFARESKDGRITLVLVDTAAPVRSLWALLVVPDLDTARKALAKREGIPSESIDKSVGYWSSRSQSSGPHVDTIAQWATTKQLDGVVWAALKPGFKSKRGQIPTADEVVTHLRRLCWLRRRRAEQYIRRAPRAIDTVYRRRIESELGWFTLEKDC